MSDMVNHPAHYARGPEIKLRADIEPDGTGGWWAHSVFERSKCVWLPVECIDVIRHIKDMRLANAMKYIWRVAFGGKDDSRQDIEKAIWYLRDWLDFPEQPTAIAAPIGATAAEWKDWGEDENR